MFGHLATLDAEREPAGSTVSYCELLPLIFCQVLTKKTRCGGNKTGKQSNPCWKNLQQQIFFAMSERITLRRKWIQCDSWIMLDLKYQDIYLNANHANQCKINFPILYFFSPFWIILMKFRPYLQVYALTVKCPVEFTKAKTIYIAFSRLTSARRKIIDKTECNTIMLRQRGIKNKDTWLKH